MLEKIFELANKTGDRCIVWDVKSQKAFIVLPFEKYEELLVNHANISENNMPEVEEIDFIDEGPAELQNVIEEEQELYFEPIE